MRYVKIEWIHPYDDEPSTIFIELAEDHYEERRIELFPNGKKGYATKDIEVNGTFLGETSFPSVKTFNELNEQDSLVVNDEKIIATEISKVDFSQLWESLIKDAV